MAGPGPQQPAYPPAQPHMQQNPMFAPVPNYNPQPMNSPGAPPMHGGFGAPGPMYPQPQNQMAGGSGFGFNMNAGAGAGAGGAGGQANAGFSVGFNTGFSAGGGF